MNSSNRPSKSGADDQRIAIIGMACRFPGGVNSPEEFWEFLLAGGDGIVSVPEDRWDSRAYHDADRSKKNRMYVNRGGFLAQIDQFDPLFFGMSPAEANRVDPQHRWLLEITYEAIENAGLKASELRGSETAVYIGQFIHDYEHLQLDAVAHGAINQHTATGVSATLTSNRISYVFDFRGPSLTLDTACSSSLVALDLACRALHDGDCGLALAGGVNILLRPEHTMAICKASMLSPDGLCKSFDKGANGYVRSEGAGVVLLKRLADAERDGDRIFAVIRATGVNQDGQTPGITVPSGDAQRALLLRSLRRAGVGAEEIQYVEAHGTGTAVGDPIEVNALGSVFGPRAKGSEACVIGSVKSNIGHAEAAAGMAGLIKTVLALNHGVIPGNLHFQELNPGIDLERLNLRIALGSTSWPDPQGATRKAVVNSFGFGGTNANVVLESPMNAVVAAAERAEAPVQASLGGVELLLLSAKSEASLKDAARRYDEFFARREAAPDGKTLRHIAASAALRREHHRHRAVLLGGSELEMRAGLSALSAGAPSPLYVKGLSESGDNAKLCFVFSGMGTQWPGMGQDLYRSEPAFRAEFDRVSAALSAHSGWSLLDVVFAAADSSRIDETEVAQPAIFAVQVALSALLKSWGIEPAAVVGHSAGEVAAAYVAGALNFEDAVRVAHHRSRLQQTTEGSGRMLAVALAESEVPALLAGFEASVSLAAVNSASAITLSGDAAALAEIAARLEAASVFARFLKVGVPYHSPVMERLKIPLIEALRGIRVQRPQLELYSSVTGSLSAVDDFTPEYWARNVRDPVRFQAAIEAMVRDGGRVFLEVAPHSALATSVEKNLLGSQASGTVAVTLEREQPGSLMLARTLASLHVGGSNIDWERMYSRATEPVALPNYAWQHARYWCEEETVRRARLKNLGKSGGLSESVHPLLGGRVNSASTLWQLELDLSALAYLGDHQLEGEPVFPGAGYVEMALAAAMLEQRSERAELEDVEFLQALFLKRDGAVSIESSLSADGNTFAVAAFDVANSRWVSHFRCRLGERTEGLARAPVSLSEIQARCENELDRAAFYERCRDFGLVYAERFQGVRRLRFGHEEVLVEIALPPDCGEALDYRLHPVVLDSALQGVFALLDRGYVPAKAAAIRYERPLPSAVYGHIVFRARSADMTHCDLSLLDEEGVVCVEVHGLELRALRRQESAASPRVSTLYESRWELSDAPAAQAQSSLASGEWLLLADDVGLADRLAGELTRRSPVSVRVGSLEHDLDALLRRHAAGARKLVCFLSEAAAEGTTHQMLEACQRATLSPLRLERTLSAMEWQYPLQIYVVTRGAHLIDESDDVPRPALASTWGFVRVMAEETLGHRFTLVDLPGQFDASALGAFAEHLLGGGYEQEIALRGSRRYVGRLCALTDPDLAAHARRRSLRASGQPFEIGAEPDTDARLELTLRRTSPPAPTPDHVVLELACVAVSHADLLSLGAFDADQGATERCYACAGVVREGAEFAWGLVPGDAVVGFAGALSTLAAADRASLVRIPAGVSAEQAALLAAAFVPAHYALSRLAVLRPGMTVVIHEAADTRGRALLQLALRAGARVFATAASSAGRAELLTLGAERVYESGTFAFVDGVLAETAQRGVDVVVNVLRGPFVEKTCALLKPLGAFVDLGSSALAPNPALLEQLRRKGASFHAVDLATLCRQNPEVCGELLREVVELFAAGALEPLPLASYACSRVTAALEHLAAAGPFALAAVTFDAGEARVAPALNQSLISAGGSYLVTGGLGGLGLEVMRWLVEAGARSVVLIGRSRPSESADRAIEAARSAGATVTVIQADVAESSDVANVLSVISRELAPLRGVVHAAGVLDDALIAQQDEQRIARVLRPKVCGAWNLHQQTLDLSLDFFVLFSSIAPVVGWAGQSNYAAANAFLDGLAHQRRALGLPALSINWGPWADAGMAADMVERDQLRLANAGIAFLSARQALASMQQLLESRIPEAVVFAVDWRLFFKHELSPERNTRYRYLVEEQPQAETENLMSRLSSAGSGERADILAMLVMRELAEVLGVASGDALDRRVSVFDYGVNSLMGMDLLNRLQSALRMKLPSTLVLKHPSVDAMVKTILEQLASAEANAARDELYWAPEQSIDLATRERNGRLATLPSSVHHWIYEGHNAHFNVGALLELDAAMFDRSTLELALRILFTYHDGCRGRVFDAGGGLVEEIRPLGASVHIEEHDLCGLGYDAGVLKMNELNEALHASFRFTDAGPLYRVAYYQLDHESPHRLFLIFHHYVVDGWSLKLFSQDLDQIYQKLRARKAVRLPTKSYSLFDWAARLRDFAMREAVEQIPYWLDTIARARRAEIRDELCSTRPRRIDDYVVQTTLLEPERYGMLVAYCRANKLELSDLVAYALTRAFAELTGTNALWVDLMTHARSGIFPDLALPQLFGQIAESGSVLFEVTPGAAPLEQIRQVRRQRLAVPNAGIGLRALRFTNPAAVAREPMLERGAPQVGLNCNLTDYALEAAEKPWYRFAKEPFGSPQEMHVRKSADEVRLAINVVARVEAGSLEVTVAYCRDRFRDQTISAIAARFFGFMLDAVSEVSAPPRTVAAAERSRPHGAVP
jgi:acyl transferase domain-containing protein/NADPH:quinone reductase-like Zn-dependent oxidoreductase/acyl carrier protein